MKETRISSGKKPRVLDIDYTRCVTAPSALADSHPRVNPIEDTQSACQSPNPDTIREFQFIVRTCSTGGMANCVKAMLLLVGRLSLSSSGAACGRAASGAKRSASMMINLPSLSRISTYDSLHAELNLTSYVSSYADTSIPLSRPFTPPQDDDLASKSRLYAPMCPWGCMCMCVYVYFLVLAPYIFASHDLESNFCPVLSQ